MNEEKALEVLTDFLNAIEAACVNGRREIAEIVEVTEKNIVTVPEQAFTILTYEKQSGDKLGEYETATKKNNTPEKFQAAYNVLAKSNATIAHQVPRQGLQLLILDLRC